MCSILLSIKPEYAEKIFAGEKQFEFRRLIANKQPKKIVIYMTAPYSKVFGEVIVEKIIKKSPMALWKNTKKAAGISYSKFMEYFRGCETAYAYCLGKVKKYRSPKKLEEYGISAAPQSFVYLEEKL